MLLNCQLACLLWPMRQLPSRTFRSQFRLVKMQDQCPVSVGTIRRQVIVVHTDHRASIGGESGGWGNDQGTESAPGASIGGRVWWRPRSSDYRWLVGTQVRSNYYGMTSSSRSASCQFRFYLGYTGTSSRSASRRFSFYLGCTASSSCPASWL